MRPGRTRLTVTPSAATSLARVLDQPSSAARSVLETARFGIGATTPDEATVITRPHRRSRMPGTSRLVRPISDRTMAPNCWVQISAEVASAAVGGGPPELLTRMSTCPSALSASSASLSPMPGVIRSAAITWAACGTAALSLSAERPETATVAPASARPLAMAPPRPPLAPSTSARLPLRSIFMVEPPFEPPSPVRSALRRQGPAGGSSSSSSLAAARSIPSGRSST